MFFEKNFYDFFKIQNRNLRIEKKTTNKKENLCYKVSLFYLTNPKSVCRIE